MSPDSLAGGLFPTMRIPVKAACLLAWMAMLVVSIANGAFRDYVYGPSVDALTGHQISTASGILLLALVIRVFVRCYPPASLREALGIGAFWTALTVAFEFLFFHYVAGYSWSALLASYDVSSGRVWIFMLLWVFMAPAVFHLRAVRRGKR